MGEKTFDCNSNSLKQNIFIFGENNMKKYENDFSWKSSAFGAFTDVNIWKRHLSREAITSWQKLDGLNGDYISWNNASIRVENMLKEELDIREMYHQQRTEYQLILINTMLNFEDSKLRCKDVGGEM